MGAVYVSVLNQFSRFYRVQQMNLASVVLWFNLRYLFFFSQPKDGKKEKEPDRGSKMSSYNKVGISFVTRAEQTCSSALDVSHMEFALLVFFILPSF